MDSLGRVKGFKNEIDAIIEAHDDKLAIPTGKKKRKWKPSNGFASFYLNPPNENDDPDKWCWVEDVEQHHLSTICKIWLIELNLWLMILNRSMIISVL